MLKLTLFEFIFRGIPELVLFIFASYIFSRTKIDKKNFIIAIVVLNIMIYFVRMLPISYGIHTILNIIIQTTIVVYICKIDVIKAIRAAILSAILLFITEAINVALLNLILKDNIDLIFQDIKMKTLYGFPSLIGFALVLIIYELIIRKRNNKKHA